MSSVTFSVSVGGDGSTVTDDSSPTTGLGNGGHRTRFVPSLAQLVAVAAFTVNTANAAAASAAAAATGAALTVSNATSVQATSTTSIASGLGSKSITIQTGKSFIPGMVIKVYNADTVQMIGTVTSYNSGTGALVFTSTWKKGTSTVASWTISIAFAIPAQPLIATSTTSLSLATGAKTFTCDTDCAFVPGNTIQIFNGGSTYMVGVCTAYNPDTGSMSVTVFYVLGTGTFTSWSISISSGISDLQSQISTAMYVSLLMS